MRTGRPTNCGETARASSWHAVNGQSPFALAARPSHLVRAGFCGLRPNAQNIKSEHKRKKHTKNGLFI